MVNRVKKMDRISGAMADTYHTLAGRKISKAVNRGAAQNIKAYTSTNPLTALKKGATQNIQSYASTAPIPGFKKGGTVKRTGLARLHKGELVITASAHKALQKIMKK